MNRKRLYTSISAADLQFGQPVHETHPHLLKAGEGMGSLLERYNFVLTISYVVTPGIIALEYSQRRSKLASRLPKNSIAVLAASEIKYRSGAVFFDFHQDPNFFYLTGTDTFSTAQLGSLLMGIGFNEPEAVAVIGR